jgi:hypothetical protein
VFIHEFSHALASWLTGGNVKAIRVFDNEGGITMYVSVAVGVSLLQLVMSNAVSLP